MITPIATIIAGAHSWGLPGKERLERSGDAGHPVVGAGPEDRDVADRHQSVDGDDDKAAAHEPSAVQGADQPDS
jgi:hypothetical protein